MKLILDLHISKEEQRTHIMKQGDCNQEIVIKAQLKYKGKYLELKKCS